MPNDRLIDVDSYWAIIKKLGIERSRERIGTRAFRGSHKDMAVVAIPDPDLYTPEQRYEVLERFVGLFGSTIEELRIRH